MTYNYTLAASSVKIHAQPVSVIYSSPKVQGSGKITKISAVGKDTLNAACLEMGSSDLIVTLKTSASTKKMAYLEYGKYSLLDSTPIRSCSDSKTNKLYCNDKSFNFLCKGSFQKSL
jgi:hypothetical protein